MINAGRAPFHEPELDALLTSVAGDRLLATVDLAAAVADSELTFIAVGTPTTDGAVDLRYVESAAVAIGGALRSRRAWHVVVVKSTVVPGTTTGPVRRWLEASSGLVAGRDFGLAVNPEFLTEGTAVRDFTEPDRLVIGADDERTQYTVKTLYDNFDHSIPRLLVNPTTAEFIKYASNALLATMISFSNELARLASRVGDVDALDVMRGVHLSGYLSPVRHGERATAPIAAFLEAGCGFGGSCLPKDVRALIGRGRELGLDMPLLESVMTVNDGQPDEVCRLIYRHFPVLSGIRVTILGIAFKPDSDDVRESPTFPIVAVLRQQNARITVYDPMVARCDFEALEGAVFAPTLADAIQSADVIVIATRWREFEAVPLLLRSLSSTALVVDGRRMLRPADCLRYEGIGR